MNIAILIKVDGEWVNRNQVPKEVSNQMIRDTVIRGMKQIGFTLSEKSKEKTA